MSVYNSRFVAHWDPLLDGVSSAVEHWGMPVRLIANMPVGHSAARVARGYVAAASRGRWAAVRARGVGDEGASEGGGKRGSIGGEDDEERGASKGGRWVV